jgi:hypothetical protein
MLTHEPGDRALWPEIRAGGTNIFNSRFEAVNRLQISATAVVAGLAWPPPAV